MEEDEINLIDYINVLLKRKWFILAGTLICVFSAAIYSYSQRPFYEASASLVVTPPPFKADLTPPSLSVYAYEQLARAQDMEKVIIDSLGLKNADGSPYAILQLDGMMSVKVVKETVTTTPGASAIPVSPLITLTVKSDKKELSAQIVNTWADLFVKRNSGLSTRAASGSYDFIIAQYDMARKRLEETEDAILRFKAENPQVSLSNERTSEAAKLAELQAAYTNLRSIVQAKEDSLKQQGEFLAAMEVGEKWVGGLVDEGREISYDGLTEAQKSLRRFVVKAKRDLIQAEKEMLVFNEKHQVDLLRAEAEQKAQTLAARQSQLLTIDLNRDSTRVALEQVEKQIQQESPVVVLSKAITDDALWQKSRDGALSADEVKRLEDLKLRSEQLNPVYEDLKKKKAALRLEYDSYAPKEVMLRAEVKKLRKEVPNLQERLLQETREQSASVRRVDADSAALKPFRDRYSAIKTGVERLRLDLASGRENLSSLLVALDVSRSKVMGLDDQIGRLQTEQTRMERDMGMYKSTFDRFAKLTEDARIAKAGESSDMKVVARAVEPMVIDKRRRNIALAGAVGLMLAVFLAFLIEYVEKARAGQVQGA